LKNDKMICQFISDKNNIFYKGQKFKKILNGIHTNNKICQLKEKKSREGDRLLLVFQNVNSVEGAIECLKIF